jgi:hypothetical protein
MGKGKYKYFSSMRPVSEWMLVLVWSWSASVEVRESCCQAMISCLAVYC